VPYTPLKLVLANSAPLKLTPNHHKPEPPVVPVDVLPPEEVFVAEAEVFVAGAEVVAVPGRHCEYQGFEYVQT
jgi:hypothetical protein